MLFSNAPSHAKRIVAVAGWFSPSVNIGKWVQQPPLTKLFTYKPSNDASLISPRGLSGVYPVHIYLIRATKEYPRRVDSGCVHEFLSISPTAMENWDAHFRCLGNYWLERSTHRRRRQPPLTKLSWRTAPGTEDESYPHDMRCLLCLCDLCMFNEPLHACKPPLSTASRFQRCGKI